MPKHWWQGRRRWPGWAPPRDYCLDSHHLCRQGKHTFPKHTVNITSDAVVYVKQTLLHVVCALYPLHICNEVNSSWQRHKAYIILHLLWFLKQKISVNMTLWPVSMLVTVLLLMPRKVFITGRPLCNTHLFISFCWRWMRVNCSQSSPRSSFQCLRVDVKFISVRKSIKEWLTAS